MRELRPEPIRRASGTVRLPGSKSISNRVLLLAALAKGKTQVYGLLVADDTRVMLDALQKLDIPIDTSDFERLVVAGAGGISIKNTKRFISHAGTALQSSTTV